MYALKDVCAITHGHDLAILNPRQVDYNGAHMVVANTNDNKKSKDNPDEKAIGKEQMEWIKSDIKKAKAL